jgi:hypothetical protein
MACLCGCRTPEPPDHFLRSVSFPDIPLAEGERITDIEISMSCGRFRGVNRIPNDWEFKVEGPESERTKLSAHANHGASWLLDSRGLQNFVTIMVCSTSAFDIVGTVWTETPDQAYKKVYTHDQLKLDKLHNKVLDTYFPKAADGLRKNGQH